MKTAYVGYTLKARPDADKYMPVFRAPGNYKKEEAKAEYIKSAKADYLEDAGTKALTGEFSKIVLMEKTDKNELRTIEVDWPKVPILRALQGYDRICVLSLGIFMRAAVVEMLDKERGMGAEFNWALPYHLLHKRDSSKEIINPIYEITGSSGDSMDNVDPVMRRFGMGWGQYIANSAEGLAYVTGVLAHGLGK